MTSMPPRIRRGGVTSPGKNSFGKSYLLLVVVRDVAAVERFCALIIEYRSVTSRKLYF